MSLGAPLDGQVYIAGLELDADAVGCTVPETGRNGNGEAMRRIIAEISIHIRAQLVSRQGRNGRVSIIEADTDRGVGPVAICCPAANRIGICRIYVADVIRARLGLRLTVADQVHVAGLKVDMCPLEADPPFVRAYVETVLDAKLLNEINSGYL